MSDEFRAFDEAWSRQHGRRLATSGGVRETYYAAGVSAATAENARLTEQVAALREALEAVKEIIGPAYAWAEIDRERDDTDWQACERAEKLMYAALAAAGGEG